MRRSALVVTVGVTIGVGCTTLVELDKEHVLLDEAGHGGGVPALAVCQPGVEEPCRADSGVSSPTAPVVRALAQLSSTLIMLVDEGEMRHARAVHEAIGKLLTPSSEQGEARHSGHG